MDLMNPPEDELSNASLIRAGKKSGIHLEFVKSVSINMSIGGDNEKNECRRVLLKWV